MRAAATRYELLDLEAPDACRRIVADMDAGMDVYYDNRWPSTAWFADWLLAHTDLLAGRTVFVPGAGVGVETLVCAEFAARAICNDLSPVAMELCGEQARLNGFDNLETRAGSWLDAALPPEVDLVVGAFLVYDRGTRAAFEQLLRRLPAPVLLSNGEIGAFHAMLDGLDRPHRVLAERGDAWVVWIDS